MVGRDLASLVMAICLQSKQDLDTVTKQLELWTIPLNVHDKLQAGQTLVLLMGGETTVKVVGEGLGGRNQELVLSFAIEMDKEEERRRMQELGFRVELLSCGTDGIDGMGEYSSRQFLSLLNWDFVNPYITHFVLEPFLWKNTIEKQISVNFVVP